MKIQTIKISYKPIREIGLDGIRKLREREIVQSVIRSVNQWMYSQPEITNE